MESGHPMQTHHLHQQSRLGQLPWAGQGHMRALQGQVLMCQPWPSLQAGLLKDSGLGPVMLTLLHSILLTETSKSKVKVITRDNKTQKVFFKSSHKKSSDCTPMLFARQRLVYILCQPIRLSYPV